MLLHASEAILPYLEGFELYEMCIMYESPFLFCYQRKIEGL